MNTNSNFLLFILFTGYILNSVAQESLVDISIYKSDLIIEMPYATPNNFIGKKVYNCEKCLLQPEVAKALLEANDYFNKEGYRIKIYDCYRPLDVQKKMWEIVPRATYVANPETRGSIHNKGAAIDLTIEKIDGTPLDMGSKFDFFGKESHIDNFDFPEHIIKNRKLLFDGMRKFGFQTIRTEWWHFSYKKNKSYPTLNIPFPCDN